MKTKTILLAIFNSVVQYFNYAIFSLSALALSNSFMPGDIAEQKLLNFFTLIIITVLARPIGSVIFGYIGDFFGRKPAVIFAGLTSSFGAIIVYFIPHFSEIGTFAAFLLIAARMIFLCGLSGEIDGVRLYVSESLSKKLQNFGNGMVTFLTQLGALCASISLYLLSNYEESFRICFLIGGIVGIISSLFRLLLPESLEYVRSSDHPSQYFKITIMQIIAGQPALLLKTLIIAGSIGAYYQYFIIFLPSILKISYNLDLSQILPIAIFSYGFGGLFWGYISDKIGGHKVVRLNLFLILVVLIFIFSSSADQLKILIPLSAFIISGNSVPSQIIVKESLNIGLRYRVFSLGHSLGSLLISTPTGLIATKLSINYGYKFSILYPAIIVILSSIFISLLLKSRKQF